MTKGRYKLLKKLLSLFTILVFCIAISTPVLAAPTDAYTRADLSDGSNELHFSREMYYATGYIDAASLGLEEKLEGISDIYCPGDGRTYIISEVYPKIIVLDADYKIIKQISVIDNEGQEIDFSGAQGIYCDSNGLIYIADTKNFRVIVADNDGNLINTMPKPDSELIPEDFLYQPTKLAKDSNGYLYILSLGSYYGALMYNPKGEFVGFYGSNTVEANALDTLQYLWEKLTSNEVKKRASVKTLPFSFVDFDFDSEDYLVTCTGQTDTKKNGEGQLRKISYNGTNILFKRTVYGDYISSQDVNYLEDKLLLKEERTGNSVAQNMVSVAVDDDNFIYALDQINGYIYVYDNESNLLNAFGGGYKQGKQLGTFSTPNVIELNGDTVLVSDISNNSITVFSITEYGKLLKNAQTQYLRGNYNDAESLWNTVLTFDADSQLAYRGLAMVYYNSGDYQKSMEYAKIAADYSVYDLAKQEVFKKSLSDNFVLILLIVIVIAVVITIAVVKIRKNNIVLVKNPNIKIAFKTIIHPFDSFNDIKYKRMGSWIIVLVFTVLLYISFFLRDIASGFLYSSVDLRNYNSVYTFFKTIGFVCLWCVCNWLVCSMTSGKGTLKEVFVATVYSLIPLIFYNFIRVIFTNFLPLSASGIVTGVDTAVWILTAFLMIVGIMIVHEYDFFKFLWTAVVTILLMLLVVFLIFICALMMKQTWVFIKSVYTEIVYR